MEQMRDLVLPQRKLLQVGDKIELLPGKHKRLIVKYELGWV